MQTLFKDRGPEDILGATDTAQAFFETHGGKLEQKRGLIARQMLMYTDKGRISDADYEIMMGFVPGVYKSQGAANAMIEGLGEMLNTIESARVQQMEPSEKSRYLLAKAVEIAENKNLGGDIFSSDKEKTASYWRGQRAKTQVKE